MAQRDDDLFDKWRPNAKWFTLAGVKERDDKKKIIQRVLGNSDLFDIVKLYIDDQWRELEAHEELETDFADASWAEKQAFRNGQRAAFRKIKKFLPDPMK